MQNPRLAARYAKSLMDIALEQGTLDSIYKDMQGINQTCKSSSEFVALMKSPIVKADKKNSILEALFTGKVDAVTTAFMKLIIEKGREFFLPEIASSFISLYKAHNKINDVTLTTAHALDEQMQQQLVGHIQSQFQGMSVELTTKVDESLIGGFTLEANNNLFDASISRDLKDIKKQFLKNLYIPDIR
ncbi:MAG: ATP synthase F1 subunit delta [Bacteroidetes bacterium]|nr:ATP synthase F1 subunit delta [Bacteroidota bacterium]